MENVLDKRMSRRSFMGVAAGALAAAGLAQVGISASDAQFAYASEGGKTFTYAIAGDPSVSPNVITTSDRFGLMTLKLVYSPLWMCNADGINYFLAESYDESDDHLTLTVHLREGVKWNDGEPFTADDVVFTLEAMENNEISATYGQLVYDEGKVAVEKVDDLTVTVTFPTVNASATEMLSGIFIAPKHLYEGISDWENNDVNSQGVGTGPYKLDEYQVGQYLKFSANPDYFLGAPKVDNVVFQIITNENTGMQAIQAGEVNAWIGTPAQVEQMNIEGNGLKVTPYGEGRVAYVMFNAKRVSDERVRKALLYTFDKHAIAQAALLSDECFDLVDTFLPPENSFYAGDQVERYDQDVEKAKALLQEAGASNLTLTLGYSGSDSLQQTAAVLMQEQAAAAGITLTLQGVDATALSNDMKNPDNTYDLYFGGYIMGIDPSTFSTLFVSDAAWNYSHYDAADYPKIDELFNEGAVETDSAKRKEIYTELQQVIQDAAFFYPLYSNKRLLVTTQNVGGFDDAKLVPIYTFEDLSKLTLDA